MATVTQASVFLGTVTGILHLFRIFPAQYNAKVAVHALFSALTVLLLFASLATGRFGNVWIGILAFLAAGCCLVLSVVVYRNRDPKVEPALIATYAAIQLVTLVLVLGSSGLGLFR